MRTNYEINLLKPHDGQQDVLSSQARFKVLLCGRRWGKSLIAQIISIVEILWKKQVAYITPTYSLSKVFFEEVLKVLPKEVIKTANKTDLVITLITGGSLQFFTGERLDNLRGRKFHYVIIDESAFIPDLESAWLNAIRPTLTDYQGKAIFISTPKGKDYFYNLYLKGLDERETDWESFHFSTYDNPHLLKSEIDSAKAELPEAVFNQEYMAIAGENSASVVSMKYINANTLQTLSTNPSVVYGIDISAGMHDYCVITGLDSNGSMSYFDRWLNPDFDVLYNKVKALPKETLKVVDKTGLGQSAVQQINKVTDNVIGYDISLKSKPELIKTMILGIEQGSLHFNQHTANELSIFEYQMTSTGHIKYGNKSGGYDDAVIALALAYKHLPNVTLTTNWANTFNTISW